MKNRPPFRIVIVGRPNVGKSTLFNRLLGRRRALVHDLPGVTRDRMEEKAEWWINRKPFPVLLVDTGGLGGEHFSKEIAKQVDIALERADLVIFLLDSKSGVTPLDHELCRELSRSGILARLPVLGVVNKVDVEAHEDRTSDFYELGLESVFGISAEHARGIDDLQKDIARILLERSGDSENEDPGLDEETPEEESPFVAKIAVVGKPNVGKSTLVNAMLGENRMITSPIAGTTVDSIDSVVDFQGRKFLVVDTAGIRRKSKTEKGVEVLSVVQTRKTLERADIALLVLDGEEGITDQDEKIGGLIESSGCSVVLIINKWDTQARSKFTPEMAAERIRKQMAYLKYAPILFVSALERKGLGNLGDLLEEVNHQRKTKVSTHEFTEWVRERATVHNPKNAKFYLCHQTGRRPPTFVCHVNDPDKIDFSLKRHLINGVRDRWGYMGTPLRMLFIEGKNRRSLPRKKNTS